MQAAYVERMRAYTWPVWVLNGDFPAATRADIVKSWSDHDGAAVICCMIQVAGIGYNMTAARHGSFLDELFTPGINQQAIDRLHRIGSSTTHPVQIRKYIARGTIESRVQEILRIKTKLFKDVIEDDAVSAAWKKKLYDALMEKEDL